jgi:hypothetical protein
MSPELDAAVLLLIAQYVKRPLPSAFGNHPLVKKAVDIDRNFGEPHENLKSQ